MKRPVYLIGCGKTKLGSPTFARDLYIGQLFRKSMALVDQLVRENDGHVFILSAKHGLLDPEAVVSPYNLALTDLTSTQRRNWGIEVVDTLAAWLRVDDDPGLSGREYAVLAGRPYVEAVEFGMIEALSYVPPSFQVPMHGKGIGSRLAWLNERISATA